MADIQATFECSVELTHFYNVDLYVGGYYQIRSFVKCSKKTPCKIEISIPRSVAPHLFPASVVNGRAVGTTFEILYRDEDIKLTDIFEFKIHIPLKFAKLAKTFTFCLTLELWYIDKEEMVKKAADDVFSAFECVSKRYLTLNVPVFRGLHYHRPVIFDYFHLCAVSLTSHVSLVGLAKPPSKQETNKLSKSKNESSSNQLAAMCSSNASTPSSQNSPKLNTSSGVNPNYLPFDEAIFGNFSKSALNVRLQSAYQFHRNVCWLLLTAYEALELKLTQLLTCLPSRYQIRIQSVDCAKKFEVLQQNIQRLSDENEIAAAIDSTATLLSAELCLLWNQFLDLFRSQETIGEHLAKEHHLSRVRRFAESFFLTESSTISLLVSQVGHTQKIQEKLVDHLRKSIYFQQPLPLGVACEECDGTPDVIPVVFEERFQPIYRASCSSESDKQRKMAPSASQPNALDGAVADKTPAIVKMSKNSMSLDLPYVNRPAASAANKLPTNHHDGKKSIRRKLFSRTSSLKLWRKTGKMLTFPLSDVELTKFERKTNLVDTPKHLKQASLNDARLMCASANEKSFFGSMPNLRLKLKPPPVAAPTSVDDVKLNMSPMRKIDSDPSLTSAATANKPTKNCVNGSGDFNDDVFENDVESDMCRRVSETSSSSTTVADACGESHSAADVITSPSQLPSSDDAKPRLTSGVEDDVLNFVAAKEDFKSTMKNVKFDGHLCSDFTGYPSRTPYFAEWTDGDLDDTSTDFHLVVCVHGLDGTSADLRMVRTYIELGLASTCIRFLMSKRNQVTTFDDFETMTKNLVDEVLLHLSQSPVQPTRISFVGHSLGNIIIRSALCDPRLEPLLERLQTFLSLNGPHCGILYNNNSVVNMGIRLVQRWKKSMSLQQLALKDSADLRECFLYKLSQKPCLQYFKNVLLVGSHDDYYVPIHSACIQMCRAAMKDSTSLGAVYSEMVQNLSEPLVNSTRTTVVRYSVYHSPQASSTTSQILGRAAHIAVLDSDLFIEKLLSVSALRYFE